MAENDFVMAVPKGGGPKRLVPKHYLENPELGYKLPPSSKAKEPATPATTTVKEPAAPENPKEASE